MLKTPKTKAIVAGAKQVGSFAAGAMVSRAVNNIVPVENTTTAKAIVAGGALLLAVAYKGPKKELVTPTLLGMAAYQTVDLVSQEAAKHVNIDRNAGMAQKFAADALGLAGSCACTDALPAPCGYPSGADPRMLNGSVEAVVYNEPYDWSQAEDLGYANEAQGV